MRVNHSTPFLIEKYENSYNFMQYKTYFDYHKFNEYFLKEIFLTTVNTPEKDIYRNTLDPFSAKVDILINGINCKTWVTNEKIRQKQKTINQKVGEMHQSIVGFFDGWDDLGEGSVIDVVNHKRKIIAEIKNKHNTTKGNHKKVIYDDLISSLKTSYPGYTAYYVEVLPKNQNRYNKPFTPSDNENNKAIRDLIQKYKDTRNNQYQMQANSIETNRPVNENIRVIDGLSWYTMVSGDKNFVYDLYNKHLINAIKYSHLQTNNQYLKTSLSELLVDDHQLDEFLNKAYQLD